MFVPDLCLQAAFVLPVKTSRTFKSETRRLKIRLYLNYPYVKHNFPMFHLGASTFRPFLESGFFCDGLGGFRAALPRRR